MRTATLKDFTFTWFDDLPALGRWAVLPAANGQMLDELACFRFEAFCGMHDLQIVKVNMQGLSPYGYVVLDTSDVEVMQLATMFGQEYVLTNQGVTRLRDGQPLRVFPLLSIRSADDGELETFALPDGTRVVVAVDFPRAPVFDRAEDLFEYINGGGLK